MSDAKDSVFDGVVMVMLVGCHASGLFARRRTLIDEFCWYSA